MFNHNGGSNYMPFIVFFQCASLVKRPSAPTAIYQEVFCGVYELLLPMPYGPELQEEYAYEVLSIHIKEVEM